MRTTPLLLMVACARGARPGGGQAGASAGEGGFTILAINDVYRIGGLVVTDEGGLSRVRGLRAELEAAGEAVLMLHAGDALSPSLLGRVFAGEQMVDVLNRLDGAAGAFDPRMVAVLGNHEFDLKDPAVLSARLAESEFTWLDTNVTFTDAVDAPTLARSLVVDVGGVEVGLFGLVTDAKTRPYIESFADPVDTARRWTASLRQAGAEVVVGLTHLSLAEDVAVLEALGEDGPDLIIGGHEHSRQAESVGGRPIYKADAEARSATVLRVSRAADGVLGFDHSFVALGADGPARDADIEARIEAWWRRYDEAWCVGEGEASGCLDAPLGEAAVPLVARGDEIRRYETNLGNLVADAALAAFAEHGAQVAFLNSGSLRLDEDIPAGAPLSRRIIEELIPFDVRLALIEIDGAMLSGV